ncbi:MAG: alpha/beta fold hydrolase [Kouleothrix sp.]|nr:alpha/beta fold hydrolase [Kouleothrix sp.]
MIDLSTTEHFLERPGCRLRFWLSGPPDHPLVVLTHGAALDHRMFDPQVAALAREYRVLTWDVRGHGGSRPNEGAFSIGLAADDLAAILDKLGAASALLVGHSMGGMISQELAFRQPERVAALALFGCSCITLPISRAQALAQLIAPLSLRLASLFPYDPLVRQSSRLMAARPEVQAQAAEMMRALARQEYWKIIAGVALSMHHEPGYRINQPLLVIRGEHDRIGKRPSAVAAWAKRDPHLRYAVIRGAGHNANQDDPARFNALLLEFVRAHARAELHSVLLA